jgi:predicted phosphate transport protein (TIGR00153 family)
LRVPLHFRPVDTAFYDLIAESAGNLVRGAELLAEMLSGTVDNKELASRMHQAEHDADETTHAIIRKVNTTFVTPFDREDIYRLASGLDDVMDFMDEAVDLVNLYECPELPSGVAKQVDVLQRSAEVTAEAMPKLRSMRDLESYWIEVNRLENEGDKAYRRVLAKLFSGKYDALTVLKLKDVVDALEKAIDAFESVANTVEQIAVKES